VASLSQGRTAAAQCGLFTHKSVPVIFEPPCITAKHLRSWTVSVHANYAAVNAKCLRIIKLYVKYLVQQ